MTITNEDERRGRVNNRLMRALDGTDDAGRTAESQGARDALRDELRAIPEDATPERVLDLREAALNNYLRATKIEKGRRA